MRTPSKTPMGVPRILVLLATHNGVRFVQQQVDSILEQEGVEVRIVALDDDWAQPLPVRMAGRRHGYPYHVPYRAILPAEAECDNLVVPVALSCTHVGISSIRVSPAPPAAPAPPVPPRVRNFVVASGH